jgi:hypothetical protein
VKRILLVASVVLCSSKLYASDAVDTRISFTVADDNVAKGPQKSPTASPSIPNFTPSVNNRLFFDDFERSFTGFENMTHLVLYKKAPGFFAGVDTEGALVIRATFLAEKGVQLLDAGSYLRLTKKVGDNTELGLTAFPISADRFRLGYSYDISWGGSRIFPNARAVPGLRLEINNDWVHAYLGLKTGLAQVDESDGSKELDTVWGVLSGASFNVLENLRVEGGAGFFHRGTIDKQELRTVSNGRFRVAPWQAYGGSAQITFHEGDAIGIPIDFRLYRNDPLVAQQFFVLPKYDDNTAYTIRSEASVMQQTLQNSDKPTSTRLQTAYAGDVTFLMRTGHLRLQAYVVYRNLPFVLFNVPSYPSFVSFPQGTRAQLDVFSFAGLDYYFETTHLLPGFMVGVRRPANMTSAVAAGASPPSSLGQQTLVFRSDTDVDILDPGDKVKLIYSAKATLLWQLSDIMSVVGELQYSYDPNRRSFSQDPGGVSVRLAQDPNIVGFMANLNVKF